MIESASGNGWTMYLGRCEDALPTIGTVDHLMADPPYSEHVHKSVRSAKRNEAPDVVEFECRTRRAVDLGFEHLSDELRHCIATWAAANVRRWCLVFSDVEGCGGWRDELTGAGLDYVRTMAWIRVGGAPQFTGDRPASGFEAITVVHPKGRKRWNGGGKAGIYTHPIVANRLGQRGSRCHPTQKPVPLMLDLVSDFTDEGELICDPNAGSGTTGVAALRLGRRFVGVEMQREHFDTACQRLEAEERGSTLQALRSGQGALFGEVAK